jgi:hypothetical protein
VTCSISDGFGPVRIYGIKIKIQISIQNMEPMKIGKPHKQVKMYFRSMTVMILINIERSSNKSDGTEPTGILIYSFNMCSYRVYSEVLLYSTPLLIM